MNNSTFATRLWETDLLERFQAPSAPGVRRVLTIPLQIPHGSGRRRVPMLGDVKSRRAAERADLMEPNPAEAEDRIAARVRLRDMDIATH